MSEEKDSDLTKPEKGGVGSFTFERQGKVISIKSSVQQGRSEIVERIQNLHPKIKKDIDDEIAILLKLMESYDPTDFLVSVSWNNCFCDPETYTESQHEGLEAYAEYALSLALTKSINKERPHALGENLEVFSKTIISIFDKIALFFITERSEKSGDNGLHKFRYSSIMSSLYLRGDSTEIHHLDLVRDLFEQHNGFLLQSFGYDISQIISCVEEILRQINENVNKQKEFFSEVAELHKLYNEYSDRPENKSKTDETLAEEFFSIVENKERKEQLQSRKTDLSENIFEIIPNEKLPLDFINRIVTKFGSNSQFANDTKYSGWPTNSTIINKCPVITDGGRFYCYVPQLIFRNIIGILEHWIRRSNQAYYQNKYQKRKGEYLERKSLEYLSKLLPNAKVYGKLFYKILENGETINAETDGLLIYDNNLFILEAKAGQYHPSARRGSIEKIKVDVERLISDAYNQALRTKDYIFTTTNPVFRDRNGRIILEIEDISKFQNVFLLNTTLENLGHISSHLNSLRQFGLIEGREWPWSVFLNDLRTISELVETPSEFLMYLKRRIRANDFPAFSATDELDFLMVYFREGLFFEDGHLDGLDYYKPSGYTDAIDRYYHSQMGLVSSSEKPTLIIPSEYRTLIINIEKTEKFGFSQVTTALLDFKLANQKKILDYIEQLSNLAEQDKKCHDATFITDDLKLGLTIVVDPDNEYRSTKYDTYSNFKKYQTHSDTWIILILQITEKQIRGINFEIKNFPWKYSRELEQKVKRSQLSPEGAHPDIGKRIGRNEKCPCGSGKKFKKCCGDRVRESNV